jgi:hypothetical protein
MRSINTGSSKSPGQKPEVGDKDPSGLCCRGAFEVLCETAAPAEPGEGAFDYPSPRQQLEAFDAVWPLDDLDLPWTTMGDRVGKLLATVDAVSKDTAQLGESTP